jgi:hypothetical protein
MKNNNCPICGSTGDDLVFKFYCSSPECANYMPSENKEQAKKVGIVYVTDPVFVGVFPTRHDIKVLPIYKPVGCILCEKGETPKNKNNDIFDWPAWNIIWPYKDEEIKFLKHTDIYKDFEFIKNNIFSAMNVPKEYFPMPTPLPLWVTPELTLSPSLVPKFEISWVDSLTIECRWKDKIPDILNVLVEPILERSLGRYTEEVTKEVSKMLYRLTNKGWLTWNGHEARWEVHCAG